MRYIVQRASGQYVQRLVSARGIAGTYWPNTPDHREAHDFKSKAAALKWMSEKNEPGKIHILTDAGFWPED